jgi:hypothetical protein
MEETTMGRGRDVEKNGEGRRLIPWVANYGEAFYLISAR